MSEPELNAFESAAISDTQPDPVGELIAQIVDKIRGFVSGCSRNTLGEDGTIPSKLKDQFLALAVMEVMGRAGGNIIDPNGHRARAYDEANAILKLVAACRYGIDQPETPSTEVIGATSPSICARTPRFKRCQQDGI